MKNAWRSFLLHALLYFTVMDDNHIISIDCGGYSVSYTPTFGQTKQLFGSYLKDRNDDENPPIIKVDQQYLREHRWLVSADEPSDAFLEFQCLMLATGNHMLADSRALFHGVAFIWRDLAWILTAPSGTGKTTQYRIWRNLWRKEIRIINGDKPVLECRNDGTVWVHSSPWKGKENAGKPGLQAKLGGIILLEQGDHNEICRMKSGDAVIPLWIEFVSEPENSEQIMHQADILDRMLNAVPVWKLVNVGNEDSAILTRNTLSNYLEDRYE